MFRGSMFFGFHVASLDVFHGKSLQNSCLFRYLAQLLCSKRSIRNFSSAKLDSQIDMDALPLSIRALALEPPNAALLRRFPHALRAVHAIGVVAPLRQGRQGHQGRQGDAQDAQIPQLQGPQGPQRVSSKASSCDRKQMR